MTIYNCETPVVFGEGMTGSITGVCIRMGTVKYEVSYFYEGKLCDCWLYEYQFTTEANKKKVGFHPRS